MVRCTVCRNEYTEDEIKGKTSCPGCNTRSIACDTANDVTIKINWHELRILCMWAENWARQTEKSGNPNGPVLVSSIAGAIKQQHPERTPLTLAGEIRNIQKEHPDLETNIDISTPLIGIKGGLSEP